MRGMSTIKYIYQIPNIKYQIALAKDSYEMNRSPLKIEAPYILAAAFLFALLLQTTCLAQTRQISFSGQSWDVRKGSGGPGPNKWSDDVSDVWVDSDDRLHLSLKPDGGTWSATEIISTESFGYGEYRWKLNTNVENFDSRVVLGLFTYLDDANEIDIEFSKFGNADKPLGNFTTQPAVPGNTQGFEVDLNGDFTTHRFIWSPDKIEWTSHHGHFDSNPPEGNLIHNWTYQGTAIPLNLAERVHMNLWGFRGKPPSDGKPVEVIISNFKFTPLADLLKMP